METTVNDKNFREEVLEESLPVLVDFWAPWCGPCLRLASVVKRVAKEYNGRLKVCTLNVDGAPRAAADYKIMSIPTLAVFKKGKVVKRIVGALPKAELEAVIKRHI